MVQKPNKSLELARKFKRRIGNNIHVDKMVLFGSRAKGIFTRDSDFDLLIVSGDFRGVPWYKRPVKLYSVWNEDYPLELLCYTPEEVKRKSNNSIVSEAMKTGIKV